MRPYRLQLWEDIMTKETPMNQEAASRIQSAADRNPNSDSAQSGFSERAQSAAARNEQENEKEQSEQNKNSIK